MNSYSALFNSKLFFFFSTQPDGKILLNPHGVFALHLSNLCTTFEQHVFDSTDIHFDSILCKMLFSPKTAAYSIHVE